MLARFVKVATDVMADGKWETSQAEEAKREAKYGKAAKNIFLISISIESY